MAHRIREEHGCCCLVKVQARTTSTATKRHRTKALTHNNSGTARDPTRAFHTLVRFTAVLSRPDNDNLT